MSFDRARVWPHLPEGCILHEDDALLAVNKPAGVPSQAADPERPDDLVFRLKRHFQATGKSDYLGVHQRLDKDTSGVLVMTRRRDVNAAIAAQFEGRTVEKTYLAAVTGWPRGRAQATLRDQLAPGDGGRSRVVSRGGQLAVTHVKERARHGDRALLELRLETGRMHQARVQLAHARAPIAGDVLYDGAPAPRLLLHAESITLKHPAGRRATYRAPAPPVFESWLARGDVGEAIYDDEAMLASAIDLAVERRFGLGHAELGPRATTAFRLVHEEGDGLPGLAVDLYGAHLVVQFYGSDGVWSDLARRERVIDALVRRVAPDGVYVKIRPKQANTLVDTRREEVAPKLPVRGVPSDDELVIFEEGVPYRVRLADGLSTGIFLDQRQNRARLRSLAAGKRVLNLFSYTCAFTVAAVYGGATHTVSVDASAAALERGRAQLVATGHLERGQHEFVAEDAFAWLARAAKKKERFDLVVLDPPSYSSTKARRFVAGSDYAELVGLTAALVARGGRLLACTNRRGTGWGKLRHAVSDGARAAGRSLAQLKDMADPADFPVPPGGEATMKSVLATFAD